MFPVFIAFVHKMLIVDSVFNCSLCNYVNWMVFVCLITQRKMEHENVFQHKCNNVVKHFHSFPIVFSECKILREFFGFHFIANQLNNAFHSSSYSRLTCHNYPFESFKPETMRLLCKYSR